jgi:hypothetical protein
MIQELRSSAAQIVSISKAKAEIATKKRSSFSTISDAGSEQPSNGILKKIAKEF